MVFHHSILESGKKTESKHKILFIVKVWFSFLYDIDIYLEATLAFAVSTISSETMGFSVFFVPD